MKIIKNEGILMTREEYESIEEKDNGYFLKVVQQVLTEEEENVIREKLSIGESRPSICKFLNISESDFNKYIFKKYGTRKISDIKAKINESKK